MPLPLYPLGKSLRNLSDKSLGGPQSLSERREENKILDPTGTRPARSQSLYWLRYPGSAHTYRGFRICPGIRREEE
jgi:hypothetical protein